MLVHYWVSLSHGWGGSSYHPHFRDEETKVQSGLAASPRHTAFKRNRGFSADLSPDIVSVFCLPRKSSMRVCNFSMLLVLQFWHLPGLLSVIGPFHFCQDLSVVLIHQGLRPSILPLMIKLGAETLGLGPLAGFSLGDNSGTKDWSLQYANVSSNNTNNTHPNYEHFLKITFLFLKNHTHLRKVSYHGTHVYECRNSSSLEILK